jgi:hypothetical protein
LDKAGFVGIQISPRRSEAREKAKNLLIFTIGNLKAKKKLTYMFETDSKPCHHSNARF